MKIGQIHLIYFSPVFHTRSLARLLGNELAKCLGLPAPRELDITPFSNADPDLRLKQSDLAILAAPVYGGRLPEPAVERFKRHAAKGTPAVLLVSYGNRAFEDALLELKDTIRVCGFKTVAATACIAEHTIARGCAAGRPDMADAEAIRNFAASVAALLGNKELDCIQEPDVPGNHPYRQFKHSPLPQHVDDKCVHCGLCAQQCPTFAIDIEEPASVNPERCICCMRCVNICPTNARHADTAFINAVSAKLAPVCAKRKENSFFMTDL